MAEFSMCIVYMSFKCVKGEQVFPLAEKNALHSPTSIDTPIRFFVLEPFNNTTYNSTALP
jgi:hypothetical protein